MPQLTTNRSASRTLPRRQLLGAVAALAGGVASGHLANLRPDEPTVTLVNTGSGGLVLTRDRAGRRIVIGGSGNRADASAALDRYLPPWERPIGLLLVPPPHAALLPGALDIRQRRPVANAALLALAAQRAAVLEAWAAARPASPITTPAVVQLAAGVNLRLLPYDGAALAVLETTGVAAWLAWGALEAPVRDALARGYLAPPAVVARLSGSLGAEGGVSLPAVTLVLEEQAVAGPGRTSLVAAGGAVDLTLRHGRVTVGGVDRGAVTRR